MEDWPFGATGGFRPRRNPQLLQSLVKSLDSWAWLRYQSQSDQKPGSIHLRYPNQQPPRNPC